MCWYGSVKWYLGRIIVMVYFSKLDNAICLEFVEQETTAPKDMKQVHTLNHHHKTVSSKQIVKFLNTLFKFTQY